MKYLFTVLSFFILFSLNGQEITDQMKGKWIIERFQSAGPSGMSNQMAEFYIGDTVTFDNFIRQSFEENEFTRAAGLSPIKCEFRPGKKIKIEDPIKYFSDKFEIKPIVLGIKEPSEVYLIKVNCKDDFFKEIHFDVNNDKIFLFTLGMFFILDRLEK
ncbi:MAG: hypothetical protein IPH20_04425 [Bacteroidales bacterium]|nr:hypothetical protein [Bacteroidales bacterium]